MVITRRKITAPLLPNMPFVLQRIYAARNILAESELSTGLDNLLPFDTLKDIDKACIRLEKALRNKERILIIGDFDADGATSTALAVSALRAMGAHTVEFLVPNRFEFGYGLTKGIVEVANQWHPKLIITVDNGIASVEGVEVANQMGIDVLITDHHLPGEQLPNACAIVNPNQALDAFPSKAIAGVGVIFYVMMALRRYLLNCNWFQTMGLDVPNMAQFLDLVALGTVADVVPLDQNNRILVSQGLLRIKKGLARPGILSLLEVASKEAKNLRASDLGFSIAPRLNAAGRLDDMSLGIDCLLSEDLNKARVLALELDELNIERRRIEADMKEQAMLVLNKLTSKVEAKSSALPIALCLTDKSWHQGVIGILAGRLKERYHRPVIVFAHVSDDELKGSARSVMGLNIRDVLAAVDKDNPQLITKFGGHAMAAGLSIKPLDFSAFQHALVQEVGKHIDLSQCEGEVLSDGPLNASELSMELATLIRDSGPWGQQFPEPLFDNRFEILDQRIVGQNHLKLSLKLADGGEPIDAIAFNIDLKAWPNHRARFMHAAYKLDINTYLGRSKLQLLLESMVAV